MLLSLSLNFWLSATYFFCVFLLLLFLFLLLLLFLCVYTDDGAACSCGTKRTPHVVGIKGLRGRDPSISVIDALANLPTRNILHNLCLRRIHVSLPLQIPPVFLSLEERDQMLSCLNLRSSTPIQKHHHKCACFYRVSRTTNVYKQKRKKSKTN